MLRPEIHKRDPESEGSLETTEYSSPEVFWSLFNLGRNQTKERQENALLVKGVDEVQQGNFNYWNLLKDDPIVSPEQIIEMQKERPGLFIPQNTKQTIANILAHRYDDNLKFNFIGNHRKPGMLGWASAFGGGLGATLFDPIAFGGGSGVAKIFGKTAGPMAAKYMNKLAVKGTVGSTASQVADKITQHAISGAGFGAGAELVSELGDENTLRQQNRPSEWIAGIQRIFHGMTVGALIGGGAAALHTTTFGIKTPKLPNIDKSIEEPHQRFETPEDAEAAMKEHQAKTNNEFKGQYHFGKDVNTGEITLRIGNRPGETLNEFDGIEYEQRGGLFNKEFMKDLPQRTKDVIGRYYKPWSKVADITAREEAIGQGYNGQIPDVSLIIRQGAIDAGKELRHHLKNNNIDVVDLNERMEATQSQLAEQMQVLDKISKTIPDEVKQFGDEVIKVARENPDAKFNVDNMIDFIQRKTGIQDLDVEAFKASLPKNFTLEELTNPKTLRSIYRYVVKNIQNNIGEQQLLLSDMRNKINDTYEPLTENDMRTYAKHLKSLDDEPTGYVLPDEAEVDLANQLEAIEDSEINYLLEKTKLKEIENEFEQTKARLRNQPQYKKMIKEMTDCILRSTL